MTTHQSYPTDLSNAEWKVLEPHLPQQQTGRPRKYSQRQMLNALWYLLRTGCAWRMLPHDLPPWQAVYAYFRKLEREGIGIRLNDRLRELERVRKGREAEPSTLAADSQSEPNITFSNGVTRVAHGDIARPSRQCPDDRSPEWRGQHLQQRRVGADGRTLYCAFAISIGQR